MGLDMYQKILQIKTNTYTTGDKIHFDLYHSVKDKIIGELRIRVAEGEYKIRDCTDDFVLFSPQTCGASESADNPNGKIWSIFIREDRLKIICNRKLLLDHCLCKDNCTVSDYDQEQMNDLKRNIGKIQFHNSDKEASLEWRNYDASQDESISSTLFQLTISRKLTNLEIHI